MSSTITYEPKVSNRFVYALIITGLIATAIGVVVGAGFGIMIAYTVTGLPIEEAGVLPYLSLIAVGIAVALLLIAAIMQTLRPVVQHVGYSQYQIAFAAGLADDMSQLSR